ncbi:MAG: DNA internalization-related competence protein ComEC/Rec2 [Tissierellia bacterium]|nr:DNA internalization-related competence protein ComEC/Rec2 [Tissierellia bacterium]
MKRPVVYILISFIFSSYLYTFTEGFSPLFLIIASLISIISYFRNNKSLAIIVLGFLFGFLMTDLSFNNLNPKTVNGNYDVDIVDVKKLDTKYNDYYRYQIINNIDNKKAILYSPNNYQIADRVIVKADKNYIQKNTNPYLYNMRNHYISRNIKYQLEENSLIEKRKSKRLLLNLKKDFDKYIRNIFDNNLKDRNRDFVISLILSDKFEYLENIRNLGLSHILVISGLHIDIIMIFLIFSLLKFGFDYKIAKFFAIFICFVYAYFLSFPFSIIRVLIMNIIEFLSYIMLKKEDKINSIFLSALIIEIIYPFAYLSLSFQLSYLAMISIYIIYSKIKDCYKNKIIFVLVIQAVMMIFTSNYFGYINPMSFVANLIVLPIFTIILYMVFFIIIFYKVLFLLKVPIFLILDFLISFLLNLIDMIFDFSFEIQFIREDSAIISLIFLIVLINLVYMKKRFLTYNRIYIILTATLVISSVSQKLYNEMTEVSYNMIDIGQGDAFLLKDKNDYYMIDVGGGNNSGENTLIPILKAMGIKKLKAVFISHNDEDHSGNLEILDKNFKIENLISTEYQKVNFKKYENFSYLKNKDTISLKSGSIKCIFSGVDKDENDKSLGLLIDLNSVKILTLGDLSSYYEDRLNYKADILKLSHHGSKNSTSKDFINKTKPNLILISAGRNNRYNHPSKEALENVKGIKVYNTQTDGFVKLKLNGDKKAIRYLKGGFFR